MFKTCRPEIMQANFIVTMVTIPSVIVAIVSDSNGFSHRFKLFLSYHSSFCVNLFMCQANGHVGQNGIHGGGGIRPILDRALWRKVKGYMTSWR